MLRKTLLTLPIMLTAAAASLGLVPIAPEIFWGPMAYAMIGGIIVGTVLTLVFLPALYVAWFRIKEPKAPEPATMSEPTMDIPVLAPSDSPVLAPSELT
jgi:multidrug efflux pump